MNILEDIVPAMNALVSFMRSIGKLLRSRYYAEQMRSSQINAKSQCLFMTFFIPCIVYPNYLFAPNSFQSVLNFRSPTMEQFFFLTVIHVILTPHAKLLAFTRQQTPIWLRLWTMN
mmetsp:Transcript_7278/g.13298  ORF Transcript_7278/g.13298 Transcript_7278/m.13298 type:complete len:116 (-) Transcript_7278:78-425(-)